MTSVGLIFSSEFDKHVTGPGHPERPERLTHSMSYLQGRRIWWRLTLLNGSADATPYIKLVHTEPYLKSLERSCAKIDSDEFAFLERDTTASRDSFAAATRAAGAIVEACRAVMKGELDRCFCAVRPPGHHASSERTMGFCLINNVAVGAMYLKKEFGLKRIAIVDWDVHHGNGTERIFYSDPEVLFISLHQWPFYPGTGLPEREGSGPGAGFTLNIPMRAGSGDSDYLAALREVVVPRLEEYDPQFILISSGFDAHRRDPLADIELTEQGFYEMTRFLTELANRTCEGRIVSTLEGGYDLQALGRSIEAHLRALAEEEFNG